MLAHVESGRGIQLKLDKIHPRFAGMTVYLSIY